MRTGHTNVSGNFISTDLLNTGTALSFLSDERSGTERAREKSSDSETHHVLVTSDHDPLLTGVCDGGQGRGGAVRGGGAGGSTQQTLNDPLLLPDGLILVADQLLQVLLLLHQVSLEQIQRLGVGGGINQQSEVIIK